MSDQPYFHTVAQAVALAGERFPGLGFTFQDHKGDETAFSFADVEEQTAGFAAALQALGLQRGDRVALVIVEPREFVLTFLAALRIGVIPVPLYPPLSFGALDAYAERTARVLALSGARVLVASSSLHRVLWGLVDLVSTLEQIAGVEDFAKAERLRNFPEIAAQDIAFLQYTSGSTSDPKGVIVTHANLIANAHALIAEGVNQCERGTAVSWLPLYHDMGLIGFVIAPICEGLNSVFIPTTRFIRKPAVWFDTITRHKGTVTFAPNFAYALITRRAKDEDIAHWDLSTVEAFGCGAEPIHPDTVRAFSAKFEAAGASPHAFLPAYGMAEATLGISFKPVDQPFKTRKVDATRFTATGQVVEVTAGNVLEHVSCGPAFKGHELVAMDEHGQILPEGFEGELCLRGPSVARGYWENPEATRTAFTPDGWLHTGDLGYLLDGEVYVTGRLKDLIILNGRNLHPQSTEWRVGQVEGVRMGNVVAFSRPGIDSEELVVVLETRLSDQSEIAALIDHAQAAIRDETGAPAADVVCLPPGSLPKTSSGKLQRRKTRQQYLLGQLGHEGTRTVGASGDTLTVARHYARGVWAQARHKLLGH